MRYNLSPRTLLRGYSTDPLKGEGSGGIKTGNGEGKGQECLWRKGAMGKEAVYEGKGNRVGTTSKL
jgi:hypothetical protein